MMIIFAFKKGELKEKTQEANFSLPIKNPNPLLKNWFRIRISKLTKNWADSGSRIRIWIANPTKTIPHPEWSLTKMETSNS